MTDKEKEIVQALRCTSTPGGPTGDCEKCPYWKIEQLTAEQKEKLGVDTWTSCDIDKVGTDAADLIERLTAENVALREGASLGKVKRPQKIAYEKSIEFLRAVTDGQSDEIKSLRRELEWKDMVIALAQRKQAKAEAERDALREKKRWIPVTEKTPEYDMPQLALNADGDALIANYAYGEWFDTWGQDVEVTHWMPLPEAPEVDL